jgi:hypothetical protein
MRSTFIALTVAASLGAVVSAYAAGTGVAPIDADPAATADVTLDTSIVADQDVKKLVPHKLLSVKDFGENEAGENGLESRDGGSSGEIDN